jgi:hypothetical protein
MQSSLSVLAEFIGGGWQPGNALAMNFFKCFGYVFYSSESSPVYANISTLLGS